MLDRQDIFEPWLNDEEVTAPQPPPRSSTATATTSHNQEGTKPAASSINAWWVTVSAQKPVNFILKLI